MVSGAAAAAEPFGNVALTGLYADSDQSNSEFDDEETQGSAIVPRVTVGTRWGDDKKGDESRIQFTSAYYNYFERKDRWYNAIEAEHVFRLSDTARFGLEGAGALNTSTIEARSADQLSLAGHLALEPNETNRVRFTGAVRRRFYDDTAARSWAPLAEVDYRHRFGRYQYLVLTVRKEWTNSSNERFDYRRTSLEGFYTHPIGQKTRFRAGIIARWWKWDARFTPAGEKRHDRLFTPQVRLTHEPTKTIALELDYRRLIRRSNDATFDRSGNRLAATVRYQF